ncbi:MAG TPA: hypothetical protein VN223_03005 [Candidatus Elarobacter sp.]|nr:hypothetical protein [Candidatus Elarobacter sp.]
MSKDIHENDPFFNLGRKIQDERTEKSFRQPENWAALERAIQKRLAGFLIGGLPRLLWRYSRTSVLLFIIPWWLYVLSMIGVGFGVRSTVHDVWGLCVGLFFATLLPLIGMAGSMIYAYRNAFGISKIIAAIQIPTAALFVIVATYRALCTPLGRPPYAPQSAESVIAVLFMIFLFVIAVVADIIRQFTNRQSME